MRKLAKTTVSASTGTITFTGLDTTLPLHIVLEVVSTAPSSTFRCTVNGGNTLTDYYSQQLLASTVTSAVRLNSPSLGSIQGQALVLIDTSIIDGHFSIKAFCHNGGSYPIRKTSYVYTGVVATVNSLTFTLAGDFQIGTTATVYERYDETVTPTTSPLDDLSVASAWSVRRLLSSYSGPLFEVTRSSDSTSEDIYALQSGDLDWATLGTFVGSDNAVMSKIYDQKLDNDLTGTAVAIATAGVFPTRNGVLTPTFDGTSDMQGVIQTAIPAAASARSVSLVYTYPIPVHDKYIFSYGSHSSSNQSIEFARYISSGKNGYILHTNAPNYTILEPWVFGAGTRRFMWSYPSTTALNTATYKMNGVTMPVTLGSVVPNTKGDTTGKIVLGERITGGSNFIGTLSETIILSDAMSSTDLTTLDTNQSNYYGS